MFPSFVRSTILSPRFAYALVASACLIQPTASFAAVAIAGEVPQAAPSQPPPQQDQQPRVRRAPRVPQEHTGAPESPEQSRRPNAPPPMQGAEGDGADQPRDGRQMQQPRQPRERIGRGVPDQRGAGQGQGAQLGDRGAHRQDRIKRFAKAMKQRQRMQGQRGRSPRDAARFAPGSPQRERMQQAMPRIREGAQRGGPQGRGPQGGQFRGIPNNAPGHRQPGMRGQSSERRHGPGAATRRGPVAERGMLQRDQFGGNGAPMRGFKHDRLAQRGPQGRAPQAPQPRQGARGGNDQAPPPPAQQGGPGQNRRRPNAPLY